MPDLSTSYMGLKLDNPLLPSASPLTSVADNIKLMEDSGAGAIVMHSLFEEQITAESKELDYYLTYGAESYAEALSYFPDAKDYRQGPEQYLNQIVKAKQAVSIPVIGSLNGVSSGGWISYAKKIEQAGADALELNIYFIPTDPELSSNEVEDMYVQLVRDVSASIKIPVSVKLSPFFTNLSAFAHRLSDAGAKAIIMFNRFYQPDLDLEQLEVISQATLSTPSERQALTLPLRWVAILYGQTKCDLALNSGVHSAECVLKALMAGAKVAMMASTLLQQGIPRLGVIKKDLIAWMEEHEYESVQQMIGSMSQRSVAFPAAFERAHYMRAITRVAS